MASERFPDNQEDREVYPREHNAANFHRRPSRSSRPSKAVADEPDALDYAYHSGMTVTMAPDEPNS